MHPPPLLLQRNAIIAMNVIQITIPITGKIHQNPDAHHIGHHLLLSVTV
jgi:hypothetical protein